jgi:pantetheine-phosphate adenylyltransferase
MEKGMPRAAYSGSFDPPTYGHIDIIGRASAFCRELLVLVGENPGKRTLLSVEERVALLRELSLPYGNVSVESCSTLIVDHLKDRGVSLLIRGIRGAEDFSYEFEMAQWNRRLAPHIETLFLPADPAYTLLHSSAVKELRHFKKDLTGLVPPQVLEILLSKPD